MVGEVERMMNAPHIGMYMMMMKREGEIKVVVMTRNYNQDAYFSSYKGIERDIRRIFRPTHTHYV